MLNRPPSEGFSHLLQVEHQKKNYSVRLLHAGEEEFHVLSDKQCFRRPHQHAVYHIVLYKSGNNRFWWKDAPTTCKGGTLVVSEPNIPHSFPPYDVGSICYREVTFDFISGSNSLNIPFIEVFKKISAEKQLRSPYFPLQLTEFTAQALDQAMKEVAQSMLRAGKIGHFAAEIKLADLFLQISSLYLGNAQDSKALDDRIDRARIEIEKHYQEPLTVASLAQSAGCSVGHFHRLFASRFGRGPIDYLLDLRLRTARQILLSSSLRCREVGMRVGIEDEYYFSKIFKQKFGLSPLQYRKKNQSIAEFPSSSRSTS